MPKEDIASIDEPSKEKILSNSPYAKVLFCRKIANSFLDAIFAATSNLYLMAKWLVAVANFIISSLQNATIEANIWLA